MFCSHCGKKNADAANFCYACGAALSAGRPTATVAPPAVPSASLPVVLRTIAVALLLLGGASAVVGVVTGAERIGGGDTSVPALQNFSTAIGGVVVALYGFLILRRHRQRCNFTNSLAGLCPGSRHPPQPLYLSKPGGQLVPTDAR